MRTIIILCLLTFGFLANANPVHKINACVTNLTRAEAIEGNSWKVWRPNISPVRATLIFDDSITPTADIVLGQAKLGFGEALPLHFHEQTETYRIISGEGLMTLGDQTFVVRAGDYVFIPSNYPHQIIGNSEPEELWFEFTFAASGLSEVEYIFLGTE
ncbi:MAG: cupin domain-containing protein [Pseudomonadota bacterium]